MGSPEWVCPFLESTYIGAVFQNMKSNINSRKLTPDEKAFTFYMKNVHHYPDDEDTWRSFIKGL